MKQKLRLLGISAVTLLLAVVTLTTTVLADVPTQTLNELFDYGVSDESQNETVAADALLSTLLGTSIPASERNFLTTQTGITLRYNNAIPDSTVTTQYDETDRGCLEVWVQPYSYTANNGAVVEWIPKEARIGQKIGRLTKQGDRYGCVFNDLRQTENFYMGVSFEWKVELPAEAVEELINLAYQKGNTALNELLAHEVAMAEYDAKMQAYVAYQEYLSAKVEYDAYLIIKEQYDKDLEKYLAYKSAYDQYVADLALWESWNAYWAYKAEFDKQEAEKKQYQIDLAVYEKELEKVNERLNVLANLFVLDSNNWQLYGSLMGGMVTMVLEKENQDSLVAAGCNRQDVESAGEAAIALRALMKPYFDLMLASYPTPHDRTAAYYEYYCAHYAELRDNFSQLCTALNSLCACSALIMNLDKEGKLLHYRQFVGLLYVTATCLDDNVQRKANWKVNGQLLHKVMDAENIIPDDFVADPATSGVQMPAPVIKPDWRELTPVAKPDKPQPQQPTEPTPKVTEPTSPGVMEDPGKNGIPTETAHPGTAPQAPEHEDWELALVADIRSGVLRERQMDQVGKTYRATTSIRRLVPIDNRKLVSFYAWDGKTLLSQFVVEKGAAFTADGIDTTRANTAQYTYEFIGWKQPDGSDAVFVANTDVTLIAQYRSTRLFYTVTWILNGVPKEVKYAYGVMPTDPFGTPPPEQGYRHVFSGWSPSIRVVTEDITYEATLTKEPILYTVTWDLGDRTVTTQVPYLSVPSYEGIPAKAADSMRYSFLEWSPTILPITGDVTYTARYTAKALATAPGGTVYNVTHTDTALIIDCTDALVDLREAAKYAHEQGKGLILRWKELSLTVAPEHVEQLLPSDSGCTRLGMVDRVVDNYGVVTFKLAFFNAIEEISLALPMKMQILYSNFDGSVDCSIAQNEEWVKLDADSMDLTGAFSVRFCPRSAIHVSTTGECNISKIPSTAPAGTLIDLSAECESGYEISGVSVKLADGTVIPVENRTFYMPDGEVFIELTVSQIVYEIIYRVDGQEYLKKQYSYGEEIEQPERPTKASDGSYDYTFLKWSKDVIFAMGEERVIIIDAVFNSVPVVEGDPYLSGNNNNFTLTVIVPIVGSVLLVGGVALTVVLRKRKRRRAMMEWEMDHFDG